jgi:hypothetical protein
MINWERVLTITLVEQELMDKARVSHKHACFADLIILQQQYTLSLSLNLPFNAILIL